MAKWNYKGETFDLDDGLSAQDATAQIKQILSDRQATAEASSISGTSADETFGTPVSLSGGKETERGLLGDVGVGFVMGVGKALKNTSELVGMYYDLKYNTTGTSILPKEDNELPTEDPFPIAGAMVKTFEDIGEGIEDITGIEGETKTIPGKIADVAGQFIAPGLKGAGLVSKSTRLGRLDRITRARTGTSSLSRRQ